MSILHKEVFLASRFEEFHELRALLRQRLDSWSAQPPLKAIDLNNNFASPNPPLQTCLAAVRQADVMVLLLGDTYGGIPPGERLSYTHLEYHEALKAGVPVLVYCIGDSYAGKQVNGSADPMLAQWQAEVMQQTPAFHLKNEPPEKLCHLIVERVVALLQGLDPHAPLIQSYYASLLQRPNIAEVARLYTSLDAEERAECFQQLVIEEDRDALWKQLDTGHESEPEEREDTWQPWRGEVLEVLTQASQAILLGEPGSGKSTCLRRILVTGERAWREGADNTVFIYYELYKYKDPLDPPNHLSFLEKISGLPQRVLKELADNQRLCLLLDGFNESPAELHAACMADVRTLCRYYPGIRIVISSRTPLGMDQLDWRIFTVQPMTQAQQLSYLTDAFGDAGRAERVLALLAEQRGGEHLANNPMILWIISKVGEDLSAMGRAQLYRRYFEIWSKREKVQGARAGWQWNEEEVRAALARLAFDARLQELRGAMDVNWAVQRLAGTFGDRAAELIEDVAQGLLFYIEEHDQNRTFRFAHETVQEYLAAEHLVRHREAAAQLPLDRADVWSLTLAFAFELTQSNEAHFADVSWQIDPLLTAVALREDTRLTMLPISEQLDPWVRGVLHAFRDEAAPEAELISNELLNTPPLMLMAKLRSDDLWYAGTIHERGRVRLERLKSRIVEQPEPWGDLLKACCDGNPAWKQDLADSHDGLLLPACGIVELAPREPDDAWAKQHLSIIARGAALRGPRYRRLFLYQSRTATLFVNSDPTLLTRRQWLRLCEQNVLGRPARMLMVTPTRLPEIAKVFIPHPLLRSQLIRLIPKHRLDDAMRLQMTEGMPTVLAAEAAEAGLLERRHFSAAQLDFYIHNADSAAAFRLVKSGVLGADEFPEARRRAWAAACQPGEAMKKLYRKKLVRPEDFSSEQIESWRQTVTGTKAAHLTELGLIKADDYPPALRQDWIASCGPREAIRLIKMKLVLAEQFAAERKAELLSQANAQDLTDFITLGVIQPEEIPANSRPQLAHGTGPHEAALLVEQGVLQPDAFPDARRRHFGEKAGLHDLVRLAACGLINGAHVPVTRRREIADSSSISQAVILVRAGILTETEYTRAGWSLLQSSIKARANG